MSKRYIPIARKFFESEEWTAPRIFSEQEAWLDMVFLACFADHAIDLGKDGILHLERGEFYYPQRQLAKRWGWPLSKVNRHLARLAEGTNPRIVKIQRETQSETRNETQSETLNNKGYNNKGVKNTHTHYTELKNLFVRACWHACDSAEACKDACRTHEEMCLLFQHDPQALAEHKTLCQRDKFYHIMFEFYRCYPSLQCSFTKPLIPSQMRQLLRMYEAGDIWRIIEAIDNKREQVKGNSLFQTIKQWATTDIVLANRRREQLN